MILNKACLFLTIIHESLGPADGLQLLQKVIHLTLLVLQVLQFVLQLMPLHGQH